MNISELKKSIEERNISKGLYIFDCKNDSFVANQYLLEISKVTGLELNYIDDIDEYVKPFVSIFGDIVSDNYIDVIKLNELKTYYEQLKNKPFCILIVNKLEKDIAEQYGDCVITFPKLANWQIKDYCYSLSEGVNTKYLDWFQDICNNDIYRIDSELKKLAIFNEVERASIFESMVNDGAFDDLSSNNIFDFTNAIVKKDKEKIIEIFDEFSAIDIEPIGVVTIMYNQFKKLVLVWMSRNPTEQSIGLSSKQIYAINKLPRTFTQTQLLDIFDMLTQIDYKLKTGEIETKYIIDYVVCKIFTA